MVSTTDAVLATSTMFALGLVVVILASKLCPIKNALAPLLALYLFQVVLTLLVYAQVGQVLPDEGLYDRLARSISGNAGIDPESSLSIAKFGWAYVLGGLYKVFGAVPQVGLILNATAMALVPIAVVRATVDLGWARAARPAMLLASLAPPFLMWGTRLLREGLVILSVAIVFAAAVRCRNKLELRPLAILVVGLSGLFFVRGTAVLLISVGLVVGASMAGRAHRNNISFAQGLAVGVSLLAVVVAFPLGSAYFGWDLEHANTTLSATSRDAESSVFEQEAVTVSTPAAAVSRAITGFPTALLGPLPWQMSFSGIGILTAVDAVFWWALMAAVFRGWRLPETRRGRWLCVLPAAVIVLTLTLTTGAFGSIVRYRAMALPFLIPLAAAGMSRLDRPQQLAGGRERSAGPGRSVADR